MEDQSLFYAMLGIFVVSCGARSDIGNFEVVRTDASIDAFDGDRDVATRDAAGPPTVWAVAVGQQHSCVALSNGRVLCWGGNASGQLGNSSRANRSHPDTVQGVVDAVAVTAGWNFSCALTPKRVLCWGGNSSGELGDGTSSDRLVPTPVDGLSGVGDLREIASGAHHSCVLTGGEIWCWGANGSGQLGDGSLTSRLLPVKVQGIVGATHVDASDASTCVVLQGGAVRCWGDDSFGQLGDGKTAGSRTTPVAVLGLTNAAHVSLGAQSSCSLQDDARVSCWGANTVGQLGDATTVGHLLPQPILGLTATVLSSGGLHVCATAATVECWGFGANGQLGGGSTDNRTVPTSVTGLGGATALAASWYHTCAVTDGRVSCWGWNSSGQLGDGTTVDRATPVVVGL